MDPLWLMLGSLICTVNGLIFVEVRRIRKRIERHDLLSAPAKATAEL